VVWRILVTITFRVSIVELLQTKGLFTQMTMTTTIRILSRYLD